MSDRIRHGFLLLVVATFSLSGCASLGLYDVPECAMSDEEPIFAQLLRPSAEEQIIRFVPPDGGDVCVTLKRLDTFEGVVAPEQPVELSVGPEPAIRALVGGRIVELDYGERDWRKDNAAFAVRLAPNVEQTLRIRTGNSAIMIEGIHRMFPPGVDELLPDIPPYGNPPFDFGPPFDGGGVPATQSISLPALTCIGRLRGFEHPLRFAPNGGDLPGRPEVRRTARIICDAVWRIDYPGPRRSVTRRQSGTWTDTDPDGVFSAEVAADVVKVPAGFNLDIKLERIEPRCFPAEICGFENRADPAAAFPDLFIESVEAGNNVFDVDIVDVLDLVANGPEAAGFHLMLGARLISNATSHPERNDKPFIIHEQIDVHNEEHTRFFVWGLAGQPVRRQWLDTQYGIEERYSEPAVEPCNFDPAQVCLPFRENCNPSICDTDDNVDCLEYKMLQTLLESGYDVWIVDNLSGASDITHAAAAAPLLYQRILNFGGPLPSEPGQVLPVPDIPAENVPLDIAEYELALERFLGELETNGTPLTADLASEFLRANATPERPVATEPQSGARRAIVAGYSLGGVLARIALRMWETKDSFPHPVIRDQLDREVQLSTAREVFMEAPDDKIALYVSIDAPHLGARVPVAVQAHLHRLKFMLDQIGGLSGGATTQVNKAVIELTATPARQTMQQEVNPLYKDNSLGCFNPHDENVSTCIVTSLEPDIQSRVWDTESVLFRARWLDLISDLPPRTRDGLPATIPSLGISNGAIGDVRPVQSRQVADIKWNINNYFDRHHYLCDEQSGNEFGFDCAGLPGNIVYRPQPGVQPEGGQWNGICRRITSQRVYKPIYPFIELREVAINYRMRKLFENGEPVEGTGFPTLVPTKSALFQDDNGNVSSAWRDAQWQQTSQYHTNFDNDMCRVLLFHADGAFDADQDGWPVCDRSLRIGDCRAGGRRPGLLLNPNGAVEDEAWCDAEPDDADVHPAVRR